MWKTRSNLNKAMEMMALEQNNLQEIHADVNGLERKYQDYDLKTSKPLHYHETIHSLSSNQKF